MSRQAGSIVSGDFKAAPDIRQNGPATGGWYVLRTGPKVKVWGTEGKDQVRTCRNLDRSKSTA
jgi:hypothetical protein